MPFAPLLVVLFLIVPLLEILVIVEVAGWIGGWETFALLLAESLLGAYFVQREGRRTWRTLRAALRERRMPGTELLDSALVLVGGTLLLTPGFVTDALGFVLVLPFSRPLARKVVSVLLLRRMGGLGLVASLLGGRGMRSGAEATGATFRQPPGTPERTRIVEGEVVPGSEQPGSEQDGRSGPS